MSFSRKERKGCGDIFNTEAQGHRENLGLKGIEAGGLKHEKILTQSSRVAELQSSKDRERLTQRLLSPDDRREESSKTML